MSDEHYPSPFDRFSAGPIEAYVADDSRLCGYDVANDLARHYSFSDTVYLLITGELPAEPIGRLFEIALHMAMNIGIADASVHAARVARHVHSRTPNTPAVAATAGIAVAEHNRFLLEEHQAWLDYLASKRDGPLPSVATGDRSTSEKLDAFRSLVAELVDDTESIIPGETTLTAAALALLWHCGIRSRETIATALMMARFPVAMAEAFAVDDARLWKYPLNLPYWTYDPQG